MLLSNTKNSDKMESLCSFINTTAKQRYRLRCLSLHNAYKTLHYHNHVDKNVRLLKNDNLAIRYWIAYMCLVNSNLTTPVTFTREQKKIIKEKIDFMIFQEDPEFDIGDVKDCLAGLKYDNEWDALLTTKLGKQVT